MCFIFLNKTLFFFLSTDSINIIIANDSVSINNNYNFFFSFLQYSQYKKKNMVDRYCDDIEAMF